MLKNAQHYGVESKRIIFCNRTDIKEEHMRRIQLADIFLDTNLYNGHTTVIDVLYSGVPVLTVPGKVFSSTSIGFYKYKSNWIVIYCVLIKGKR